MKERYLSIKWSLPLLILFLVVLTVTLPVGAAAADEPGSASGTEAASDEMPWLVERLDYRGNLLTRPALTGDWGGVRQQLMDKGLRFDVSITFTPQRNVSGGKKYEWAHQAGTDYGFQLDTGKAGLWPGGLIKVRGESRFGPSNNRNTGALMPANTDALYPAVPETDTWALSEAFYLQFLSRWLGVMAGKFSPRDANVFAHDETEQFMNTALYLNPVIGTTVPFSYLGAGALLLPREWFSIIAQVFDSEGRADRSGSGTVFQRGTSVFLMSEVSIKPFNLPGHQRLGFTWSDRSRLRFERNDRTIIEAIITGEDLFTANRQHEDGSLFYDFDQYLYTVPGKPEQGIGAFGRFGLSDKQVNPIERFYSIGIAGKGIIPGRDRDSFGIGYYHTVLSDKLPRFVKRRTHNEQGVELYYNLTLTPWLHMTPDVQIIDPAPEKVDTTVVIGVRFKTVF
jgi:porin